MKSIRVTKNNVIVNRINKTKEERFPDLAALQEQRAVEFRATLKQEKRHQLQSEKTARREREEQARVRSYASVMVADKMKSNTDFESSTDDSASKVFEDDFM